MDNKLSIRKTAAKMNVNKNTVFLLRHKVLDYISIIKENIKLRGTAEGDETYESINLKGTKKKKICHVFLNLVLLIMEIQKEV